MSDLSTADLVKRLREPIWSEDVSDDFKAAVVEAADRLEALEAKLREGADIVSGTWDEIYGIDDEIAWVKEAEAVLGPVSQLLEGSVPPSRESQ